MDDNIDDLLEIKQKSPAPGGNDGLNSSDNKSQSPDSNSLNDFVSFRLMITPVLIKIIFWFGVAGFIIAGLLSLRRSFWTGLVFIILSPLVWRILCEQIILFFRINETLTEIKNKIK